MCRRSAQQSELYEHQLHARHLDAPISCGSRFEREMGEIRATAPSGFQRADFKACLNVFGPFSERSCDENRMAFTMEGMENTKRNRLLIKGSIPTIHAVVPEVSEELTDRKKHQVSSYYQSFFL